MYADIHKPPPPLPQPKPQELGPGLRLLPPLSRLGRGPGLLLLVADSTSSLTIDNGVPGLLIKWAEEGFAVVEIQAKAIAEHDDVFKRAIEGLKQCAECDFNGKVGIVGESSIVKSRHLTINNVVLTSLRSRIVETRISVCVKYTRAGRHSYLRGRAGHNCLLSKQRTSPVASCVHVDETSEADTGTYRVLLPECRVLQIRNTFS